MTYQIKNETFIIVKHIKKNYEKNILKKFELFYYKEILIL